MTQRVEAHKWGLVIWLREGGHDSRYIMATNGVNGVTHIEHVSQGRVLSRTCEALTRAPEAICAYLKAVK